MKNIDVEDSLSKLEIDKSVIKLLNDNNINTVGDLWVLKRKDLKDMNFNSEQINHVIIKMQLKGIDLNKKKY